jgi:hypothetical protein
MALIVETGEGVAGANSYQSLDDLKTYAKARGVDLSKMTDAELEVLMIKAMDYLEDLRKKYKGRKASRSQALEWPRVDVYGVERDGELEPSDEIPRVLCYAQLALAIEAISGDLQSNPPSSEVIKEKVGELEIAYKADGVRKDFISAFSKVKAKIAPLLKSNGFEVIR